MHSDGLGTGRSGNGGGGSGFGLSPHPAFESREIVAKAQPLSLIPEFVLVGGSGLVHAILLSNQVHALTINMVGMVAVWDIVRVVCVGQFTQEDDLHAVNAHSNGNSSGRWEWERRHENCGGGDESSASYSVSHSIEKCHCFVMPMGVKWLKNYQFSKIR